MRSLAQYFYTLIKKEYEDWQCSNMGKGIPGRLILKEFDPKLLSEIFVIIKEAGDFPLKAIGSETGFIIALENHKKYESIEIEKSTFAELTHERNRTGDYFCLMLIADIKPTMEQVTGIDQSTVFEPNEIRKWIDVARSLQESHEHFLEEHVEELAKFVSELTNSKWNNRPFIEVDKINAFIDEVIQNTIKDGLFYVALGKSCIKLGGINRLEEFSQLKNAGSSYRGTFRNVITKTLFKDIDLWRAYNKNKEVELSDIKQNLSLIKQDGTDYDDFCSTVEKYFEAYYLEDRVQSKMHRAALQQNFDSSFPYSSVLQPKNTKPKFLIGEETIKFFSDSDIELSEEEAEILSAIDRANEKPEVNELRKFYFDYSKVISEYSKLDKAWLKEITDSKVTECNDLVIGILEVLSKSLLLNDTSNDSVYLELAKDRGRKSLERKNWFALQYFNNEYKDIKEFWLQFGSNFKLDFGTSFNNEFANTVETKKSRESKAANELHFRIVRKTYSEEKGKEVPINSWELKWTFNPFGFESSKYSDFSKVLVRKGFFHSHSLSLDPLYIKREENTPTISNIHMFLAVSSNMKKGAVVKKTDPESREFFDLLQDLKSHGHLKDSQYIEVLEAFNEFQISWKKSLSVLSEKPMCGSTGNLLSRFESLIDLIFSLKINKDCSNKLVYELLSTNTISVQENPDYCIYLPWSPYSLLIQANRNKMLGSLACRYRERKLSIANKSEGVLAKLFRELLESYGKSLFLKKYNDSDFIDLVSTKSSSGYYEFGKLSNSKNAIAESEIRSVVNATSKKFLETYPNERHHLQILCLGLFSYEHVLSVYDELQKLADDHEEQLSITLSFSCDERASLDSMYQTICESFDSSKVDSNIKIKIISDIKEVEDGEVDLIYSFDPLFAHNKIATVSPLYSVKNFEVINWEYSASRKVPTDPIARKTQFSMNNHVQNNIGELFHSSFMKVNSQPENTSFCREVNQDGLKGGISKALSKCNWLVIYDFLLSKETLTACSENEEGISNKRVLRYIQGEGSKRSLAIITDKETHYITKNLTTDIRAWRLVHTDRVNHLVDEIFTRSNSLSSDTLLRSVGNGSFSHDLVGTAGAASLLENIFQSKRKISSIFWVHLDDYLNWFKFTIEDDAFKSVGRTVNYISDLLGIYISQNENEELAINLIVCESKLTNGSKDQLTKSCKQVKSTVDLISSMLHSSNDLDFDYWLNKFYEFIVGNYKFSPGQFDFEDLISLDKVKVKINVCGISVGFHYDNEHVKTEVYPIYDTDYLYQLRLSSEDTSNVFESLLDPKNILKLFDDDEFNFKKLNENSNQHLSERDSRDHEIEKKCKCVAEKPCISGVEQTEILSISNPHDSEQEGLPKSESSEQLLEKKPIVIDDSENINESFANARAVSVREKSALELMRAGIELLERSSSDSLHQEIDIRLIQTNIRKIFGHANLPSNFSESFVTPNSIVVKLHGNVDLNPTKIFKLKANFLSVVGLKLRQVYPDPGVMVLVFDRDKRETVFFGELLNSTLQSRIDTITKNYNNKILLGQNEFSDESVYFKLDGASPHALIGGQTKSGKSILMNNMIIDLLMTNSPENLKLRLFDPKQVEFASYSRAPHLAHPVVLNKEEAVIRLKELESLMNKRYTHLMTQEVRDFETYNKKYPNDKMSREVVFFDELADWILDNDFKAEAKDIIVRLSSKGRAAGIHLILATQRPSADVVFPLLRANLDTKIALKVDRDQNSEIILGESGAENLLGYGHGIVKSEGEKYSIQVGFTEPHTFDELVNLVVDYWNT